MLSIGRARYIGSSASALFTLGKEYELLDIEDGMARIWLPAIADWRVRDVSLFEVVCLYDKPRDLPLEEFDQAG